MANTPDGVYDRTKPWKALEQNVDAIQAAQGAGRQSNPRWRYLGPFSSNEERLVQQALVVADIPGAKIQEMVRPPLPQINPFPDRYGYRTEEYGIEDILDLTRQQMDPRVTWFSGGPAGYSGSTRNGLME